MTEIRLDRTKPYSECHGERTPLDPHYGVHFMQAYKVGKKTIHLPFDSAGVLMKDDGKTAPWETIGPNNEKTVWFPLYSAEMRELVAKLKAKQPDVEEEDEEPVIDGPTDETAAGKAVDLRSWLRGEFKLTPQEMRLAIKAQKGMNPQTVKEAVVFLVEDEQIIPRAQLSVQFQKYLPAEAA